MRQNSNWVQSALESSKQILISASCKYLLSGFARRWRSSFSLFWPTRDVWWCEVLDDRWSMILPITFQRHHATKYGWFLIFCGNKPHFYCGSSISASPTIPRSTEELQPERQNKKLLPTKGILVVELAIFSIFRSFWDALQTLWREFLHKSGTEKVVRMVSTVNENNVWRVDFLIFRSNLPLLVGSR